MISQVSQIRSIELSGKLTDTLDLLTRQQRMSGAGELIGKFVQAISTDANGTQMLQEGVVTSVFAALVVTRLMFMIYPGDRNVAELSI